MYLRLELLPSLAAIYTSFPLLSPSGFVSCQGGSQGDTTGLHSFPSSCYATFLTHAREPLVLVPLCMQSALSTPIFTLHLSLSCWLLLPHAVLWIICFVCALVCVCNG